MSDPSKDSLSKKVLAGAGWAMGMRWAIKLLGLASSAIVARQLMPEDYGLVAIAVVALGLTQVLFEFGVETAVIQNDSATRKHFDTAWTIRLGQSAIVAMALLAFSPFSGEFFDEPRLPLIMQLVSLSVLLQGFENIGIVHFRKNLNFNKDFQFYVVSKFFSAIITIALALYLQSYFALVFGMLGQSLVHVIYSYVISDYRPRFSLAAFADIWHFSKWLVLKNFADYVGRRGDVIFLTKLASTEGLGFYKWGYELSSLTTSEIVHPMLRSLMPGLVKVKSERERLQAAFLLSTGMIAMIAVPLAMGFSAVAAQFVPLFLGGGDKWLGVVPIAEVLAFAAMLYSLYLVASNMLIVIGQVRLATFASWIRTALIIASMYPAYQYSGMSGVAYAQTLIALVSCVVIYLLLKVQLGMSAWRLLGVLWRPLLAGGVMAWVLYQVPPDMLDGLFALLLLKVVAGAAIYLGAVFVLWLLSGAPDAAEKKIASMLLGRLQKRSAGA